MYKLTFERVPKVESWASICKKKGNVWIKVLGTSITHCSKVCATPISVMGSLMGLHISNFYYVMWFSK